MKNMLVTAAIVSVAFMSCKKDEKLMERMEGNWTIESSIKTIHYPNGSEQVVEELSGTGMLIITAGNSDLEKNYDFLYIDGQADTMQSRNILVTDEYRSRMVMVDAYADSSGAHNIVWTIEKQKKNKQIWSTYGVNDTLFYPSSNMDPGSAANWVSWEITLKRED